MTSLHKKIGMCVRVQVRIRLADSGRDLTTPQVMCFQFFYILYYVHANTHGKVKNHPK